jgi:hypothetical protein
MTGQLKKVSFFNISNTSIVGIIICASSFFAVMNIEENKLKSYIYRHTYFSILSFLKHTKKIVKTNSREQNEVLLD